MRIIKLKFNFGEKMKQVKRIFSSDGREHIDIFSANDGRYTLQWFISKYDPEEEVETILVEKRKKKKQKKAK